MPTVSARIPDDLEEELEEFMEEERMDRSVAIRKLLAERLEEWRRERALDLLERGEVTFSRAAELAGMDPWEFSDLVRERKPAWVSDRYAERDL